MCMYRINCATQDLDGIGIDWLGPVSTDEDNTVNVREIPNYLSEDEMQIVQQHLTLSDGLTEENMLHSFTIAKQCVYHAISQH